ncbi:MAG: S1C family serine protease [Lachnospiraceae bacterium]
MSTNEYSYYTSNQGDFNEPDNRDNKEPKKKKKLKVPKLVTVICLALVFGIVGGVTFQVTSSITGNLTGSSNSESSNGTESSKITSAELTQTSNTVVSDVSSVVKEVMPSIVSITNLSVQQVQSFFGGVSEQQVESSGSGIIISKNDSELLIVTNNHVVSGYESLTVTFSNEVSVEATVKGTDSSKDLAVVSVPLSEIDDETSEAIAIATLGDSDALSVGEPAIAIGNALGYGQSVTTGVISATNRDIEMEGFDCQLIQTDAAINPGNSGGALLNASGEVIGINTVKVSDSDVEGMGYAIPISDVSDTITELMNQEPKEKVAEADKGYLGIKGADVTSESASLYNMPQGVYISEAVQGGGAASAGIQKGYIITAIDGTSLSSMSELQTQLEYYAVGDKVELTVQIPSQNGEYTEKNVEVTLTESVG